MKTKAILKTAEKFIVDNSPGILTGLGVAGAVTTAVLTGKAAWNSAVLIESQRDKDHPYEFTTKQVVEQTWKEFIPPFIVGSLTVAAIITANTVGTRRTAAITAAFKLSEQLNEDYKKKVLETLGIQKEEKMRAELAGEKMTKNPPPAQMLVVSGSNVLMLDERSGRYFHNSVDEVRKAVNEINHQVNNYFCASLSDFYYKIGLDATAESDSIGWNTEELLEIQFSPTEYKNQPAFLLGYNIDPISGYDRCQ